MANYRLGFTPVRYANGTPWSGQCTLYGVQSADATIIGIGDLVKFDGGADTNGIKTVTRAAAGDAVCGAVIGVRVPAEGVGSGKFLGSGSTTPSLDLPQYVPATKGRVRYVNVVDDPNVLFEASVDTTTSTIALADVGLNANPVVSNASTTTGLSNTKIDGNTENTTTALTLKLIEFVQRPDQTSTATDAANRWVVKINMHQLGNTLGTVGY